LFLKIVLFDKPIFDISNMESEETKLKATLERLKILQQQQMIIFQQTCADIANIERALAAQPHSPSADSEFPIAATMVKSPAHGPRVPSLPVSPLKIDEREYPLAVPPFPVELLLSTLSESQPVTSSQVRVNLASLPPILSRRPTVVLSAPHSPRYATQYHFKKNKYVRN